jgi:phage/plasmid-associated DNA primase
MSASDSQILARNYPKDETQQEFQTNDFLTTLKILKYKPGDEIYLTALVPKKMPREEALNRGMQWPVMIKAILRSHDLDILERRGSKAQSGYYHKYITRDGLEYLKDLNAQGYGIYFRPNTGGHYDHDISMCPALFCEDDSSDLDAQYAKVKQLKELGLTPTLVIETRKSLHLYFLRSNTSVDGWSNWQKRLIQLHQGDRGIHNESRLMRAPGFFHQHWDGEQLVPKLVTLVESNSNCYDDTFFNDILPPLDDDQWDTHKANGRSKSAGNYEVATELPAVDDPFDIRAFCHLLDEWNPKGRHGWGTCQCPRHGSNGSDHSHDSLHINLSTGAFICHTGCKPKDVYRAALKLAIARGHDLPEDDDDVGDKTLDTHCFNTLFGAGQGDWCVINQGFYHAEHGYWKHIKDDVMYEKIAEFAANTYKLQKRDGEYVKTYPFGKDNHTRSAFKTCQGRLRVDVPEANKYICFNNGTLDLTTRELLPHNKKHYITSSIDANYVPNSTCPQVFGEFVVQSYGADLLTPIQAALAMYLDPTALYGYFLYPFGASGSGKGTLLRLIMSLFGQHASAGGFAALSKPETRHQYLTGVSLFAIPDVGGYIKNLHDFYELIDNGPLAGRALFSSSAYIRKWNTRFIVASVSYLKLDNAGDGWERRCLPLPTKGEYIKPNPYLGQDLEAEREQIISWALSMPKDQRDEIIINWTSLSDRLSTAQTEALITSDPISAFLDACVVPVRQVEYFNPLNLHTLYSVFCAAHGYSPVAYNRFQAHLKTALPPVYRVDGKTVRIKGTDKVTWQPPAYKYLSVRAGIFNLSPHTNWDLDEIRCNKSACGAGGIEMLRSHSRSPNWVAGTKEDQHDYATIQPTSDSHTANSKRF